METKGQGVQGEKEGGREGGVEKKSWEMSDFDFTSQVQRRLYIAIMHSHKHDTVKYPRH